MNFSKAYTLLGVGSPATATGTTLSSSPVVDLTGYTGAVAFMNVGVTATNNGLCARSGTASGSLSDLAGTWTTAHTTVLMLEIVKPSAGRYVNFQLRQGTSGQHGPIYVFGVGAESMPATGNTSTLTQKLVLAPTSGTATSS